MAYASSTLHVTITDTVTGRAATQTYQVNIPATIGGTTAHVGFTGGTGGMVAIGRDGPAGRTNARAAICLDSHFVDDVG